MRQVSLLLFCILSFPFLTACVEEPYQGRYQHSRAYSSPRSFEPYQASPYRGEEVPRSSHLSEASPYQGQTLPSRTDNDRDAYQGQVLSR